MKKKPIILISGATDNAGTEFRDRSLSLSCCYAEAILAAGGIPSIIPFLPDRNFVAEALRRCDGVMLTGGDDLRLDVFNFSTTPAIRKTLQVGWPERDLFELMLLDEVFRQRKPLLAICRGHQLLNAALGGTLILDIPSVMPEALNHKRMNWKNRIAHAVTVTTGSLLAEVVRTTRMGVNSTHHQAVEIAAKPLRANAVSKDGIIEGLELVREERQMLPYLLSVQFHPERLCGRHNEHLEILRSFTRACHEQ